MRKPRDRKTKLHTKPDRRFSVFSVYSDELGNEVLTAAILTAVHRIGSLCCPSWRVS